MAFKPDYGLYLASIGTTSKVRLHFPGFRLFTLSVLGGGYFSTTNEYPAGEQSYALSVDFNADQLRTILSFADKSTYNYVVEILQKDANSQREIELPTSISFNLTAHLGELQKSVYEEFIPLIADDIEAI